MAWTCGAGGITGSGDAGGGDKWSACEQWRWSFRIRCKVSQHYFFKYLVSIWENMNKITLALGAVIAVTATLALTTAAMSVIQQAMAVGNSSSVGKDNPIQVPLSSHPPCPNKANSTSSNSTNSTASNSSHIVKSDLPFSGNNIVKIASNNPTLEPISSHQPCGTSHQVIGYGSVSSPPT